MKNLILPPPGNVGINFDLTVKKRQPSPGIPKWLPMLSAVLLLLACCLPRTAHAQGACGEWTQTAIGAPSSGTAQFDACAPGTITITSAGIGSSSADLQYMVQRELCGDGTFDVKIESISNGRAGLEIRADNAPGAVKAGVKTPLSNTLTRYLRNAPGTAQSASSINAMGHRWLRLVRSGSNIQLFWSPNGTNWTSAALYTNIALPACARIGIFVESNNAAVATGVFNSLSGFTSPGNAPATSFSFAAGSLNAEAGQSAQVCVNIANPCACAPASVQVALQGNAAPHLSGFSTQTLQFQSGDTQKCFSLATAAAPGDGSYTLILQNPTGGNDAAIGAQSALAVAVTGEPATPTGCPWAGPDRDICRGESVLIGCAEEVQPPAGTFYCYKWTPEAGLDDPSLPQPTASPQQTTTYTVYVTDNKGNLVATDGVLVRVKPLPELSITSEPSPAIIVNGAPVELNATPGLATYSWELSSVGPVPNAAGHSIQASIAGDYVVSVTNQQGCGNSATVRVGSGNDEDDCAELLKTFFEDRGFVSLPVTIIGGDPEFTSPDNQTRNKSLNSCEIQDEARLIISLGDDQFNIADLLTDFLSEDNPLLEGFTGVKKGLITQNDNLCQNLIVSDCGDLQLSTGQIEAAFAGVDFGYWAHIWQSPSGGQSQIYISGKSNLSAEFWTSTDPKLKQEISEINQIVQTEPLHPAAIVATRDQLQINNTLQILSGAATSDPISPALNVIRSNTECLTLQEVICLAPSGIPIRIGAGATIAFGVKERFRTVIDGRALTRFVIYNGDLRGIYTSYGNETVEKGYYNYLTGSYYSYPGDLITGTVPVRLGTFNTNSVGCNYYYTFSLGFVVNAAYPPNQNRETRGNLVPNFSSGPSGTLLPINPITYTPQHISLCLPDISYEEFNKPRGVELNPPFYPVQGGWTFHTYAQNGAYLTFYAYYDATDPDEPVYKVWNPCSGQWQTFIPPNKIEYDFWAALLEVISEIGHVTLDVVGMVPIVGEAADFINMVWYLAEGDEVNAAFSAGSLIPIAGTAVAVGGRYVFKYVVNAQPVRNIFRAGARSVNNRLVPELLRGSDGNPLDLADWLGEHMYQLFQLEQNNPLTSGRVAKIGNWLLNLKDADFKVIKLLEANPALFQSLKALEANGASPAQWERFFKHLADLPANSPFLQQFAANPGIARGWKLLDDLYGGGTASKRLWDGDLIAKTTELSNDTDFLNRIVPSGADDATKLSALKDIISRNSIAPCRTCVPPVNAGNVHRKFIELYLDDVRHFAMNCLSPDASKIIETAKTATANWQIDEAAQAMRLFREIPIFADIQAITRANVAGALSLGIFDIRLTNGTLVEQKSLTKQFMEQGIGGSVPPFAQNPRILNQLNNYFTVSDNLSQLRYSFDARKLVQGLDGPGTMTTNPFSTIAEAETWVKGRFQVMMQENSSSIFQTVFNNSSLRGSLSLSNDSAVAFNQFNSLVNNSNSVLFQFIKVE